MKNLENYKVLLWDFDGVIMDSMPVRELGFRKVLESYPADQVEALIQFHLNNGGWSRYVKFRYFFEDIRKETVSDKEISDLSQSFSEVMRELLISPALLIEDSVVYVRSQVNKLPMHVVSGSDGEELRYICKELDLASNFVSIHGSPTPKGLLIKELIEKFSYDKADLLMIGDSHNDLDAALDNGIDFAAYNNELLRSPEYLYIDSFRKLVVIN
ncbi:HAD family hydrolase [Algoriphagus chordae]|uniref:phosphoglycolate phosphatase n=1 Tax=Algoriphagus chordae TaxID=237019 RepID=A0A2W7QVE7_9BACT|nr:HAD hydrolase-like protein [Algoriphagus chordae]PZX47637.1 phosphoglycolate phosphatase-like HAD superfamily hydrolase [Algoriphagus chordae]